MARIEFPSLKAEPVAGPESFLRGKPSGTEFSPVLLAQLQDDLSRSRLREAFWISLVAHLLGIVLLALSPKLLPQLWRPVELRTAEQMIHDKELTYLELPKDTIKPTAKPPDTKFLSDKNRIAKSKLPPPDRQTLESLRKGLPAPPGDIAPPGIPSVASGPSPSGGAALGQQQATNNSPLSAPATKPAPQRDLSAFAGQSVGSAIEQAARNSRGSFSTGGGGNYGSPNGGGSQVGSGLDILSDTQGVDFGPYLSRVVLIVKRNWYSVIPESARLGEKGRVAVVFEILKDGSVPQLRLVASSGSEPLDRAPLAGIHASIPFPPLPDEFTGNHLVLQFIFLYNTTLAQ